MFGCCQLGYGALDLLTRDSLKLSLTLTLCRPDLGYAEIASPQLSVRDC